MAARFFLIDLPLSLIFILCSQDKIYVYGGVMANAQICNELWAYDISAKSWENITVRSEPCVHTNNTAMCGEFLAVFLFLLEFWRKRINR